MVTALVGDASSIVAKLPRVERLSTARRSMSMIFQQPKLNFRVPRPLESQWAFARCSTTPFATGRDSHWK